MSAAVAKLSAVKEQKMKPWKKMSTPPPPSPDACVNPRWVSIFATMAKGPARSCFPPAACQLPDPAFCSVFVRTSRNSQVRGQAGKKQLPPARSLLPSGESPLVCPESMWTLDQNLSRNCLAGSQSVQNTEFRKVQCNWPA